MIGLVSYLFVVVSIVDYLTTVGHEASQHRYQNGTSLRDEPAVTTKILAKRQNAENNKITYAGFGALGLLDTTLNRSTVSMATTCTAEG